jgi:hypothetical protein
MNERDKLLAQAEICDTLAAWCTQLDTPTGVPGYVSDQDLRLRAAALRAQAAIQRATKTD